MSSAPPPLLGRVRSAWDGTLEVPGCAGLPSRTAHLLLPPGAVPAHSCFLLGQQGQIEVDSETIFKLAALVLQVRMPGLPPAAFHLLAFVSCCRSETSAQASIRWVFNPGSCLPRKCVSCRLVHPNSLGELRCGVVLCISTKNKEGVTLSAGIWEAAAVGTAVIFT